MLRFCCCFPEALLCFCWFYYCSCTVPAILAHQCCLSGAGQNDAPETMRFGTGAELLVSVVLHLVLRMDAVLDLVAGAFMTPPSCLL
ncbi:hypothetical protein Nepgr_009351 [Nepenthes gracilis]|uniref:Secreted protein n=1 Tax=Nepenthes gracilis TaxID=150966 RepID=A0AAD3SAP8_NEPGR|nr:hypothetical protein Nepgr_009351 [Nepenthes gracilis]